MLYVILAMLAMPPFQDCMTSKDEACRIHDYDNNKRVDLADYAIWQRLSPTRTAKDPDSWLVLYNLNSPESKEWAEWYADLRRIPHENLLGLDTSSDEHIGVEQFIPQIFVPASRSTNERTMGIIVGFRVPGNFDVPAAIGSGRVPPSDEGSGYSVASALSNMSYISGPHRVGDTTTWSTKPPPNQHYGETNMPTKFSIGARIFITARLDGPSLEDVKRLSTGTRVNAGFIYYDKIDSSYGVWNGLESTVHTFNSLNWKAFNSDFDDTPDCLMWFSWHRINGWQDVVKAGSGTRFLALDQNSFGATTIRSLTGHGGRFVPNMLFKAGFAAAIGATAEPYINTQPDTTGLMRYVLERRTLGEAVFLSSRYTNWMWELDGDPLTSLNP